MFKVPDFQGYNHELHFSVCPAPICRRPKAVKEDLETAKKNNVDLSNWRSVITSMSAGLELDPNGIEPPMFNKHPATIATAKEFSKATDEMEKFVGESILE